MSTTTTTTHIDFGIGVFFLELKARGSIENLKLHWGVDELKSLRTPALEQYSMYFVVENCMLIIVCVGIFSSKVSPKRETDIGHFTKA